MEITCEELYVRDLPTLFKWLTNDNVLEYYEGRDVRYTMDTPADQFIEVLPEGFRVIFEYKAIPIGYGQAYKLTGEMLEEYDYPDTGKNVFAMDQFIGEPEYWNKGICTNFLQLMVHYLKENLGAEIILLDPHHQVSSET